LNATVIDPFKAEKESREKKTMIILQAIGSIIHDVMNEKDSHLNAPEFIAKRAFIIATELADRIDDYGIGRTRVIDVQAEVIN
jgi:hypothetical protein